MSVIRKRISASRKAPARRIQLWETHTAHLDAFSLKARAVGYSRRGFFVGSAALLRIPSVGLHIIGGGNFKPRPGPRREGIDYCSEMRCIGGAAEDYQALEILGIVTAAPYQPDDVSGLDFGVTVSCFFCRKLFRRELKRNASILRPQTRLRFLNADDPQISREWSLEEFLKLFPNESSE